MSVLDAMRYQLNEEISTDGFIDSNKELTSWLNQQAGFISRQLALCEDGMWLDQIVWADPISAKQANDAFMPAMGLSRYMQMIKLSSFIRQRARMILQQQVQAETSAT
ncbi:hypothetical protein ACMYR3_03415 [Ampullimonas aquatilis]|uniref:hypothetical protein n=1 Tax=Ampullimonas aquatilis TaxID=1341549 RepID=UPI003C72709D